MSADVVEEANRELRAIWQHQLAKAGWPTGIGTPLWPLQYTHLRRGVPLFVGLNPSFNTSDGSLLRVREPAEDDLNDDHRIAEVYAREARRMGKDGGRLHPYFGRFDEMVGRLGWNHVDLIAVRHTNQADLQETLGIEKGGALLSDLAASQVQVALRLIAALQPPVVTVVNALASTIVRNRLNQNLKWDEEEGFDILNQGGISTPWIFREC